MRLKTIKSFGINFLIGQVSRSLLFHWAALCGFEVKKMDELQGR